MKLLIVTLYGNNNFGNKLQNFALQEYLKKIDKANDVYTFVPLYDNLKSKIASSILNHSKRGRMFLNFNKNINYYTKKINVTNPKKIELFDYIVYGSDQIWNTNFEGKYDFFYGNMLDNFKKISYAASIGLDSIPQKYELKYSNSLKHFLSISVRENRAKEIVEDLTKRQDIEVLIDPTMLLDSKEWDKIAKKPKQIKNDSEKYILNYFLGELSDLRKKEIERVAKANDCKIINILDKNDPFYVSGPSEFLWLEKHAFLICTDSFHSSVFAILYNRPFVVYDREEKNIENMNSRIDTLINKFKLTNRRYNGEAITKENLEHDYTEAYKILEKERAKSKDFLEKALDIKK